MFDLDTFLDECQVAARDNDPRAAIRGLLQRTMESSGDVAAVLAKDEGGIDVVYCSPEVTVLNVVWAPHMTIAPHDHRMWAAIGIYGGAEENRLYKRGADTIQAAGARLLDTGDVFGLGSEAIHAVHNPRGQLTGAIHVYGGDFVNSPRSQWDPDSMTEHPFGMAETQRQFALANAEWRAQLGQDLDESSA